MAGRVRKVLAWTPAVLLVPAAMAGAITVAQPDNPNTALTEVAPFDLGTTWVYAVSDHDRPSGTHTMQVTSKAGVNFDRLDGVAVTGTYTDYPGRGHTSNVSYFGVDGDAVVQDGLRQDAKYSTLDPPATVYKLPLDQGGSWSYDGTFGSAALTSDSTIEDIGNVEVGGRQFQECIHVVTKLKFSFEGGGGDKETVQEWTCPGYGQVRTIDSIPAQDVEITEELVEFHGDAGDWYADEPGPVTADPYPGNTIGFDAARTRALPDGVLQSALAWSDLRSADIAYPPVADDDVMVLGEADGLVTGMDVTTGEMRWRQVLAAPIVAPTVVGAGRVLVADRRKNLWALGTNDGAARWVHRFGDVVSTSPVVDGSIVVVITDDGKVTALDLASGGVVWQRDLGVRSRSAPAVTGDVVVVPDVAGSLIALDLGSGDTLWSRSLDGILTAGPAIADGRVLAADDLGFVYALSAANGDLDWETRTNGDPSGDFAVSKAAATLLSGAQLLESFDLADGDKLWSRDIAATAQSPVAIGDEVVTVSDHGRVSVRALDDGVETRSWSLPLSGPDTSLLADVPLGLVDGSLVIGAQVTGDALTTGLYAYPATPGAVRPGTSFGVEVRALPSPPSSPPTLVGDNLIVPGLDLTLYRSSSRDKVEKITSSKTTLPGVTSDGELLVAQVDDEVRGYPLTHGDQLWHFPASQPFFGSVPTIAAGRVFIPEYGVGLAAVSTDGAPLWFSPVDGAFGTGAPVPLPGGDVFYGSGGAARYDGDTGDQIWTIPDSQTYSTATYAAGVVYADLARSSHPSGLAAINANTGEVLWFHENASTQFFLGPAEADGVVVYGDDRGLVVALDASDGSELWRVQLTTPMAGPPIIIDGRVYLAELGRTEDLFQRDYRLSAHDLHSGAFLGAFQPSASSFTGSPSVTVSDDGRLLVPAGGDGLGGVVLILKPSR